MIALLLSTASCRDAQHTYVSVDTATVTHDNGGGVALDVSLKKSSVRKFALFTLDNYGNVVDIRLSNAVLARPRLMNPFLDGHFRVALNPPMDEKGATEIARQLSSGSAMIEFRVVEATR
jgi:preprotein translocase subunit SecD